MRKEGARQRESQDGLERSVHLPWLQGNWKSVDLFALPEGISEGQLCVQLCARYQEYGGQIHI